MAENIDDDPKRAGRPRKRPEDKTAGVNNAWGGPAVPRPKAQPAAPGQKPAYVPPPAQHPQSKAQWLIANPEFDFKPATIEEFLGPLYLDIDRAQNPSLPANVGVRDGVREALIEIFGKTVDPRCVSVKRRGMFTGGIGVGKSTLAAIVMAYMVHWVYCLHDPQRFFGLLPGSRIAFMLMSTKDSQAREVLFGDIKARINHSPWFKKNCPHDKLKKTQLIFPKDIMVIPGNSAETTFEGYNILGGIIDEGDSHKVTEENDYAENGWNTIHGRISSRFMDPQTKDHRGLLLAVGQMKKANGFMAKKLKELNEEKGGKAIVVKMAIWESYGWDTYLNPDGTRDSFWFDIVRKKIAPPAQVVSSSKNIIEIPNAFLIEFENDPVKALKDHAGIPPAVEDPFIVMVDRIDEAQDKWQARFKGKYNYAVDSSPTNPRFHPDFKADSILKRALHVDIAYSAKGDALGLSMGHIPELVEIDGELKPYIVFDMCMRLKPSGGEALQLADFRKIIYMLRDELGFKISVVTFDGFQSLDSIQILRKKKFNTGELSVDRNTGPYEELRDAIYERRVEFPRYMTYLKKGDGDKVNIVKQELMELQYVKHKIDHPEKGSKDVADSMAGVVYDLMGSNSFRRGSTRRTTDAEDKAAAENDWATRPEPSELPRAVLDALSVPSARPSGLPQPQTPGFGLPPREIDPFGVVR